MKLRSASVCSALVLGILLLSNTGYSGPGDISFVRSGPLNWYGVMETDTGEIQLGKIQIYTDYQCAFSPCSCSKLFALQIGPVAPDDPKLADLPRSKSVSLRACFPTLWNGEDKVYSSDIDTGKPSFDRVELKTLDCEFSVESGSSLFNVTKDSCLQKEKIRSKSGDLGKALWGYNCDWVIYEEAFGL